MEYLNERLYEEESRGSMAREDIYKMARALSRVISRARGRAQRDCPLSQVPQTLVEEFASHFMNIMQFCHKILPRKAPCASDIANQSTREAIPLRGSEGKWSRFAPLHLIVFLCF